MENNNRDASLASINSNDTRKIFEEPDDDNMSSTPLLFSDDAGRHARANYAGPLITASDDVIFNMNRALDQIESVCGVDNDMVVLMNAHMETVRNELRRFYYLYGYLKINADDKT